MSSLLDSPRHPRILAARRLHRRSHREVDGRFLVEGRQAVGELLRYGEAIEVFATPVAAERNADILAGQAVQLASERAIAALSDTVTPQGLIAVAPLLETSLHALPKTPRLVAVLVDAADPGNVGTIIRIADAAGADAVVLAGNSVDPHNGKCVRAATGSHFHLPVLVGSSLEVVIAELHDRGMTVVAADADADRTLGDVGVAATLGGPVAWLFGNEAHGLSRSDREMADHVIGVPIYGKAESLNVASAAAVCLYANAVALHRNPEDG